MQFLKEHRKVEEQGATIAKQQKQIEALTAALQKIVDTYKGDGKNYIVHSDELLTAFLKLERLSCRWS